MLLTFSLSEGNPCCIGGGEGLDSGLGVTGGLGVLLAASGASGDPQHTSRALRARLPPLPLSARGVSKENGTCRRSTVTLIAYLPIRHVWAQRPSSYQQTRYDAKCSVHPSTDAADAGTTEVY